MCQYRGCFFAKLCLDFLLSAFSMNPRCINAFYQENRRKNHPCKMPVVYLRRSKLKQRYKKEHNDFKWHQLLKIVLAITCWNPSSGFFGNRSSLFNICSMGESNQSPVCYTLCCNYCNCHDCREQRSVLTIRSSSRLPCTIISLYFLLLINCL